jgi:hypothetical protein
MKSLVTYWKRALPPAFTAPRGSLPISLLSFEWAGIARSSCHIGRDLPHSGKRRTAKPGNAPATRNPQIRHNRRADVPRALDRG